jgi:gliding motility-associated protein GldM
MAGGKETPRQKMIGMMYLVLTALLALNVSKEILDAFVVVNDGLVKTDKNFATNNALLYSSLEAQLKADPARAAKPVADSKKLKKWADDLHKLIADIKTELIVAEDQVTKEAAISKLDSLSALQNKDKYDNSTRIMCGETVDGSGGKARELKNKIIEFKKNLMSILPSEEVKKKTNLGLATEDPPRKGTGVETWETQKFYHLPVAAQIVVLTQLQTEVRNAEATVLNELFKSIGAEVIRVDKLAAQMVPSANVVALGDEFTAKIFVAALNNSTIPDVNVNGRTITEVDENGFVVFKARPSAEGEQKVKASVRFKNAKGVDETSEIEYAYTAVKPNAVVSPTKMNVFYIGVDNPVSISVAGSAPDKIEASLAGATGALTRVKGGDFIAKVTAGSKCTIPVSVKKLDGKGTTSMGAPEFRIKRIPDPTPMLLGKRSGESISIGELKSAGYISTVLENFDFAANFSVISFEFGANIGGMYKTALVNGNKFDSAVSALLNQVKPGARIFFSDIKAKGPDGSTRTLNASFKIK